MAIDPNAELQPGLLLNAITSAFDGIPFSWKPGGPTWEKKEGLVHYSGQILVFRPADVSALAQRFRPVAVTSIGDGTTVYVDYWGADPSAPLQIFGRVVANNAILISFRQGQYQFREVIDPATGTVISTLGLAECEADFVVTDNVTPDTPP